MGDETDRRVTYGRGFWAGVAIGGAIMAFGVLGLFHDAERTHPEQWVRWFLGAALVHDLLLAPVVFGAGRLVRRWGTPVKNGVVASGVLVLIAYPLVRGFGRNPANPSILPSNYAIDLLVLLAVVWAAVGVVMLSERFRRGRAP
ncbi:MAG TPA: hypothetical protein VFS18_05690 [Actinomycetota bacterium]|nr:hypothetical protein [Actinomycetota bacterium]